MTILVSLMAIPKLILVEFKEYSRSPIFFEREQESDTCYLVYLVCLEFGFHLYHLYFGQKRDHSLKRLDTFSCGFNTGHVLVELSIISLTRYSSLLKTDYNFFIFLFFFLFFFFAMLVKEKILLEQCKRNQLLFEFF